MGIFLKLVGVVAGFASASQWLRAVELSRQPMGAIPANVLYSQVISLAFLMAVCFASAAGIEILEGIRGSIKDMMGAPKSLAAARLGRQPNTESETG